MTHEKTDQLESSLISQIGYYTPASKNNPTVNQKAYDRQFVQQRLDEDGIERLHKNTKNNEDQHRAKVAKYKLDHGMPGEPGSDDSTFFRREFVKLMAAKNAVKEGNFEGDPEIRKTNPEKATIRMEDFLGKEYTRLYQLALEEEMNSEEYMNAVFRASTSHFEGEKWTERPVVVVAGPSGSGKSFAAKAAVEKAVKLLPKIEGDASGNDVVAIDGGVAREVSQMRKLVIQVANNKGYSGISNLHSQSSILENVKERMRDTLLAAPSKNGTAPLLGVVIPETFSSHLNPVGGPKLLKDINKLPDTRAVFCRVDGEHPGLFKKIVSFMGSRRAWKTDDFDKKITLDLNNTKITESKAYGAGGFKFGQLGSKLAEKWFKSHGRDNLSMVITNDLILKKEDPPKSNKWVDAEQNDKGAVLISKRVFEKWEIAQEILSEEQKKAPPMTLEVFISEFPISSLINTSAELDLAIAKEEIRQRIAVVSKELEIANQKYMGNHPKKEKLQEKLERLSIIIGNMEIVDGKDIKDIADLRVQLLGEIKEMERHGDFGFFSKTKKALSHALKALDKLSNELKDAKKTNMEEFQTYKQAMQQVRPPPSSDMKHTEDATISPQL
ncbi:hypothetical protein OQJ15_02170 [Fluoribacter dumoffii]|uniref:hypothetical protein n=1 Tax=Fluoribacter dumoffii TaxID=463 RepID=UPI002244EC3A|nr:hypothetical protein [Fluoribacter dumoffii]MCW8385104.1 hypothetical protein [Fluoribacter dumoffii]MCW8496598.1 hypothetical protein [Fluoribacter dumoffii]